MTRDRDPERDQSVLDRLDARHYGDEEGERPADVAPPCSECGQREGVEQGFCRECIVTGERIAESELTGNTYRVTRWVERGDGRITSLHKEQIDASEITERGDDE